MPRFSSKFSMSRALVAGVTAVVLGSTNVAPRWGVSGLAAGGPTNAEPWLLVANPGDAPTTIHSSGPVGCGCAAIRES